MSLRGLAFHVESRFRGSRDRPSSRFSEEIAIAGGHQIDAFPDETPGAGFVGLDARRPVAGDKIGAENLFGDAALRSACEMAVKRDQRVAERFRGIAAQGVFRDAGALAKPREFAERLQVLRAQMLRAKPDRDEHGLRDGKGAFLDRELMRRGLTVAEARELPPFAPFFRELIEFEPEACDDGIGLDAEGTLHWTGGNARYLSVLEADAQAPGVPPNFDLPEGTLWSIAVSPEATSIACSLPYGTLPEGVSQRPRRTHMAPDTVKEPG